jgi:hypothetical protein
LQSEGEIPQAREKLEALLLEGLKSSEPTEMTSDDWLQVRMEALEILEAGQRHEPG